MLRGTNATNPPAYLQVHGADQRFADLLQVEIPPELRG
jgi:hypothetical protein